MKDFFSVKAAVLYLRSRKLFICFYQVKEMRVEVWENKRMPFPQLFKVLPNFHECFYNSNLTETRRTVKFSISLRKFHDKKGKQLVCFDHQDVNSLCLCHHYVNSSCWFCVSCELYKHDFTPFSACIDFSLDHLLNVTSNKSSKHQLWHPSFRYIQMLMCRKLFSLFL